MRKLVHFTSFVKFAKMLKKFGVICCAVIAR